MPLSQGKKRRSAAVRTEDLTLTEEFEGTRSVAWTRAFTTLRDTQQTFSQTLAKDLSRSTSVTSWGSVSLSVY